MTVSEHFYILIEGNILNYNNNWLSLNTPSEAPQTAQEASEDDYKCTYVNCRFERLEEYERKLYELFDCMSADAYDAKSGIVKLIKHLFGK